MARYTMEPTSKATNGRRAKHRQFQQRLWNIAKTLRNKLHVMNFAITFWGHFYKNLSEETEHFVNPWIRRA